jgi:hypothetical protein
MIKSCLAYSPTIFTAALNLLRSGPDPSRAGVSTAKKIRSASSMAEATELEKRFGRLNGGRVCDPLIRWNSPYAGSRVTLFWRSWNCDMPETTPSRAKKTRSRRPGSDTGRLIGFQELMRDTSRSTTVALMSGACAAITAQVGPPLMKKLFLVLIWQIACSKAYHKTSPKTANPRHWPLTVSQNAHHYREVMMQIQR